MSKQEVETHVEDTSFTTKINNLFSMMDGGEIKLANGLLLFYIAVAGNFLGELFSKRLQRLLKENRGVKHLIAYITMLFSITFVAGVHSLKRALFITSLMYIWFVLTTKMFEWYNIIIILLLIIPFILGRYAEGLDVSDPKNKKLVKTIEKFSDFIFVLTLIVTVIGVVAYLRYQRNEYGSEFSYYKFFLH